MYLGLTDCDAYTFAAIGGGGPQRAPYSVYSGWDQYCDLGKTVEKFVGEGS